MTYPRIRLTDASAAYKAAQAVVEVTRDRLYAEVTSAFEEGMTYRAIAAEVGLSVPRIQQVIDAGREAALG